MSQNRESEIEELIEAAADFIEQDRRAQHVIEGWWGAEKHEEAEARLRAILRKLGRDDV